MFEIKDRWTGRVLFKSETASNITEATIEALTKKADLSYANLGSADLRSADLSYANLRYANLSSANLSSANLSSADLSYADLSSANLGSADLSYANLSYANLRYANLSSANLSSANLSSADLSYADLRSADLRSADLSYADLRSASGVLKMLVNPLLSLEDQVGKIRAYKVVNQAFTGPQYPGLVYTPGETIVVEEFNTDNFQDCGSGINVATIDWCLNNYTSELTNEGYKLMLVEFTAKDIVAIPYGGSGKFRIKKCKVIKELDLTKYLAVTD